MPADQFSPSPLIESSGVFVSTGMSTPPARCTATMASADFPRHFLRGISPGKNALLRRATAAFTSTGKPVDFAVWCQLIAPCRPSMRFLFIGSQLSHSLPPPGRSPFRSWLLVVVRLCFDTCLAFLQGTPTPFTTRPCWAHTKNDTPGRLRPTAGNLFVDDCGASASNDSRRSVREPDSSVP